MTKIKAINGIMWASDILTGQNPFPYIKEEKEKSNPAAGGATATSARSSTTKSAN